MDWRSINFDWNRAKAFLVTAEEGSLSGAARALGLAQPTLGRQVDSLEQELDVVLFERVGRGLQLTPAGLELLDYVREMGEAAGRVSMAAVGRGQTIEGPVSIAVSEIYAAKLLPPILAELRAREPSITVVLVASSGSSDLLRREADIAIRNFRPEEPALIARKIRSANARLYATPAYIEAHGPFHTPRSLARADFIGIEQIDAMIAGFNRLGLGLDKRNFPLSCTDFNVLWSLVLQGLGIGVVDDRIGDAEPNVTRVLKDLEPLTFPVWLVAHREVHRSRRLRFVFDFLAEALQK